MKQYKTIVYSFKWAGILLFISGLFTLSLSLFLMLFPFNPDDIVHTVDGIRQPSTMQDVQIFRWMGFAWFIVSMFFIIFGLIILIKHHQQKKRRIDLKENGRKVYAYYTQTGYSIIRRNRVPIPYIYCKTETGTNPQMFKSPLLKYNPSPFLKDQLIIVYLDDLNQSNYYVDLDESLKDTHMVR